MKKIIYALGLVVCLFSCTPKEKSHEYSAVTIEILYEDSVSIRAITVLDDNTLAFAGSKGIYGSIQLTTKKVRTNTQSYDSILPEFRAVGRTASDFFMLSVANPALLYKTGTNGTMELVYKEEGEDVFYDALMFWNNKEGIAVGDTRNGCLSIIITRDGGSNWEKVSCDDLPEGIVGEGAFAASNSNIEIVGDSTWIASSKSRIYFSPDKGRTWSVQSVPILNEKPSEGIYSVDFYNENLGIAYGGDYTNPDGNKRNKAITQNGGQSWELIADGELPGYKSCVQFFPNSAGEDIVAVGFTGIAYSNNRGGTWRTLSDEGFYTLRFLNDSTAIAAGRYRIAKIIFN